MTYPGTQRRAQTALESSLIETVQKHEARIAELEARLRAAAEAFWTHGMNAHARHCEAVLAKETT